MSPAPNGSAPAGNLAPQAQPGAMPASPRRVLVIDDDRQTRMALERFLRRQGYETLGFGTAGEAQGWLKRQPGSVAGDGAIAGAVIDIHLPDGDGIDLTRALREHVGQAVPIIIVSGDTSIQTLRRLKDAGGNRFVGKPMSLAVLMDALAPPSPGKSE